MWCGNFSASATCLKVATAFLIIVFILHIAGVAVPRWATITLSKKVNGIGVDTSYHAGLWKDCVCTNVLGSESCSCYEKVYLPEWLKTARVLEAIGLIGFIIAMVMTILILSSRQDKTVRGINIVMVGGSGLLIIIGVIMFGIEYTEDLDKLPALVESLQIAFDDTNESLSSAFILSTIAGTLCLLVCLPLLIKEYLTPISPHAMKVNPMSVQYTNQGHVAVPPPGQTNVAFGTSVQQPMGYMQPNSQGPVMYAPMGQPMQPAPAHSAQVQQQYGMQYPHQQQGDQPYKA